MPFWKKSEDPWDMEPDRPRPAPSKEPEEAAGAGLLDQLRDWNEARRAEKAQRTAPPPPMRCPWCGQEMESGYIATGRDAAYWYAGWPPRLINGDTDQTIRIDHEGSLLFRYKAARLCRGCRRMVLEFPEVPEPLTPAEQAEREAADRQQTAGRQIDQAMQG